MSLSPHYWSQRAQPKIVGAIIIGLGVLALAFSPFLTDLAGTISFAGGILLVLAGVIILILSHLTDHLENRFVTENTLRKRKYRPGDDT